MTRYRDTYAKVRLDYIKENVETLYKKTKKPMVAIIKANAYGHGYKEVASVLKDESIIQMFAVATLKEAVDLRDLGVKQDILVLGAIPLEDLDIAIKKNISLALFSFDYLNKINEMHRYDAPVKVHLSIDSGMNRIGFKTEKEFEKAMEMIDSSKIDVEGIFTHFATADDFSQDDEYEKQLALFKSIVGNNRFKYIHCDNSGCYDVPSFRLW